MRKYLFALLVLSLPPLLWWFPQGAIVDGTDIIFPLNPILNLSRGFFSWDQINLTGSYQTSVLLSLSKFPIYLYLSIFDFLNLPLWMINRIWYWAYLFFPSVAYFLFIAELFDKRLNKYWIGLVSATFYIYNLYYVQQIIDQAITLSIIFTPLFLFFILKGIRTKKVLFYSLLIGLFNFFYSPINPNSYLVGIIVLFFFTLVLAGKFISQRSWRNLNRLVQIVFLGSFFSILTGAYIYIPTFYYLQSFTEIIQSESADWLVGVSKYTNFINVIRLLGAWDWFETWNKEYYLPSVQIYHKNILFVLIAFLPPVIALIGFFISKNNWKYFFGVLAVTGIFLSMGSHPPTGEGYIFLYNHLPFFWIFRSPWYKFGFFIIFAYSGLIALYTEKLLERYNPKKVAILLILLFIILAHPLFFGTRFTKPEDRHGNLAALSNFIPGYVFDSANWLNAQPGDARVVMIPQIAWESTAYTWEYGNLVPPIYTLLKKNAILYLPYDRKGPGIELLKAAKVSLYTPDSTPSANYLGFLGSKFLINQKDFSYYYFRAPENSEIMQGYIDSQRDYKKIQSFGPWDIYETDRFLPRVYAAGSIIKIDNIYEAGRLDLDAEPAFILSTDENTLEPLPVLNASKPPETEFEYISPTQIKVKLTSTAPSVIVFLDSYSENWKLFSSKKPISYDHFKVNSYANGYYIKDSGNLEFEIRFLPQSHFERGWKTTFISLGVILTGILVLLSKEKMLKSRKETN